MKYFSNEYNLMYLGVAIIVISGIFGCIFPLDPHPYYPGLLSGNWRLNYGIKGFNLGFRDDNLIHSEYLDKYQYEYKVLDDEIIDLVGPGTISVLNIGKSGFRQRLLTKQGELILEEIDTIYVPYELVFSLDSSQFENFDTLTYSFPFTKDSPNQCGKYSEYSVKDGKYLIDDRNHRILVSEGTIGVWSKSFNLPIQDKIISLISNPRKENVVLIKSVKNQVFYSDNSGETWIEILITNPQLISYTEIYIGFDPSDENVLTGIFYLDTSLSLGRLSEINLTWERVSEVKVLSRSKTEFLDIRLESDSNYFGDSLIIDSNFTINDNRKITAFNSHHQLKILQDPNNSNNIYIGNSVFYTTDSGRTWNYLDDLNTGFSSYVFLTVDDNSNIYVVSESNIRTSKIIDGGFNEFEYFGSTSVDINNDLIMNYDINIQNKNVLYLFPDGINVMESGSDILKRFYLPYPIANNCNNYSVEMIDSDPVKALIFSNGNVWKFTDVRN